MTHTLKMALTLGLLGALLMGCAPVEQAGVTTVSEVDSMIRKDVPAHASSEQVVKFLDMHHIEHSAYYPGNRMISSIVRDSTENSKVQGSILVNFYFDRQARLKRYSVKEVFKGV